MRYDWLPSQDDLHAAIVCFVDKSLKVMSVLELDLPLYNLVRCNSYLSFLFVGLSQWVNWHNPKDINPKVFNTVEVTCYRRKISSRRILANIDFDMHPTIQGVSVG